ncbi:MAG: hypothetical protein ACRDTZ_02365 [Pseudonocardiaceae bacterium]
MSEPGSFSGVSPATPHGRLIAEAGNLNGGLGWRGRVGRSLALAMLVGAVLAVIAAMAGIVWLSV